MVNLFIHDNTPIFRLDPANPGQNSWLPLFCSILSPQPVYAQFLHLCGGHSWFMKNRCDTEARSVAVDHCPYIEKPRNQANAQPPVYAESFGGRVALSTRGNLEMFTTSGYTWDLKATKTCISITPEKGESFQWICKMQTPWHLQAEARLVSQISLDFTHSAPTFCLTNVCIDDRRK